MALPWRAVGVVCVLMFASSMQNLLLNKAIFAHDAKPLRLFGRLSGGGEEVGTAELWMNELWDMALLFFPATLFGLASDRLGRLPVLMALLACKTAALAGSGWSNGGSMLLVAKWVLYLSAGAIPAVGFAHIADATAEAQRAACMSCAGASAVIGQIFGDGLMTKPFLGSTACSLAKAHYVVAGLAAVLLLAVVPVALGSQDRARDAEEQRLPGATGLWFLFVAGLLLFCVGSASNSFTAFTEIIYNRFDTPENDDGHTKLVLVSALVAAIAAAAFSGAIYGPLSTLAGEKSLVMVGVVLRTTGYVFRPAPFADPSQWKLKADGWHSVRIVGSGFIEPSVSSLLTSMCPPSMYGVALGFQHAITTLPVIACKIVGNFVMPLAKAPETHKNAYKFLKYMDRILFEAGDDHVSRESTFDFDKLSYARAANTVAVGGLIACAVLFDRARGPRGGRASTSSEAGVELVGHDGTDVL